MVVDFSSCMLGPVNALVIAKWIQHPECALATLNLANNGLGELGGSALVKALVTNATIRDLDLSRNLLTSSVAVHLAKSSRGHYIGAFLASRCQWRKLVMTDNPLIGPKAAKYLLLLLSRLYTLQHVELQNIGAARGCCGILARSVRDAALTWAFCDLSGNMFDRLGMAEITWALMNNRSFRVLKLANCGAGPYYASSTDALPVNGVHPSSSIVHRPSFIGTLLPHSDTHMLLTLFTVTHTTYTVVDTPSITLLPCTLKMKIT